MGGLAASTAGCRGGGISLSPRIAGSTESLSGRGVGSSGWSKHKYTSFSQLICILFLTIVLLSFRRILT